MSGLYTVESGIAPDWEEEFLRWQREEHVPLLLGLPGYKAVSRFRAETIASRFLNVWQVDDVARFHAPSHDATVNTPWKARIVPARTLLAVRFYRILRDLRGPQAEARPAALARHDWRPDATMPDGLPENVALRPGTCRVLLLVEEGGSGGTTLLHFAALRPDALPDGVSTDRFVAL